ncbi:hypothetical protein BCR33DRAFT_768090 [Rhizoclosmatium globosum]|uniref:DNA-3-methyladenine glycosylase I n=1 Tax=Rhizoclosmatium globosum TaxID=329046 RepID=A0A1Y2C0E8_9FUNG|nr:hypothetical protein BCR33DRAFT_768090 [Rhizoclosmatium globosum]|eukprot:ORY40523.1 hypothetical protein BCR33DRAFT_768090 [Rhizoclosmatium globosum]
MRPLIAVTATRTLRSSLRISNNAANEVAAITKPKKRAQSKTSSKKSSPSPQSAQVVPMKTATDSNGITRCSWCTNDPIYQFYHDNEWGNSPITDDRLLFELLCLEGAQAGLSWITILKRRQNYKDAFDDFDPSIVAKYTADKINQLIQNDGIIRNKLKIQSAVTNANAFLKVQKEFGTFSEYLWGFAPEGGPTAHLNEGNKCRAVSPESEAMSKDLKKRGFMFVGPTICYAYMQSIGMVNDHHVDCFLYPNKEKSQSD